MSLFADAFKEAKLAKKATLREIAHFTGKSIGYLSDVLQKRKGPPDVSVVLRIEEFLGVKNHSLVLAAQRERQANPANLARKIKSRPLLKEALLRMEDLTEEELEEVVNNLPGTYLSFKEKSEG